MNELIALPCLNCGKDVLVEPDSYEANGVFNVFCKDVDGECEDEYAWNQ